MTEAEILHALKKKFPENEYAVLPQVRNGTGFERRARTADAMVMCLWPSRGLELQGIEIKVSRSDWLREMKAPQKAEDIFAYCDRWWLVVSSTDIIKDGELPSTWGLMVMGEKGIRVKSPAPKLDAKPMDRLMLAAMLRKAQEHSTDNAIIQKEKSAEYNRGIEDGKKLVECQYRELKELRAQVVLFEQESGVQIRYQWNHGQIGKAVRTVLNGEWSNGRGRLKQIADSAKLLYEGAQRELALIDSVCPQSNIPVCNSVKEAARDESASVAGTSVSADQE